MPRLKRCRICGSPILVDQKDPHEWSDLYCEKCVNKDWTPYLPKFSWTANYPLVYFLFLILVYGIVGVAVMFRWIH